MPLSIARRFEFVGLIVAGLIGCAPEHPSPPAASPPHRVVIPRSVPPAIAKSGDVELEQVKILRSGIKNQATGAELTDTTVSVRVPIHGDKPEQTLLRLLELEPVRDDTGKLLSTDERMDHMDRTSIYLHRLANERFNTDSDFIAHRILLDGPADGAKSIPMIKGKLLHSQAKLVQVEVKDLSEHQNRKIEDTNLGKVDLATDVALVKGQTEVSLHIPRLNHKQIYDWGLTSKDGHRRQELFLKASGQDENLVETKIYSGDVRLKSVLRIEFSSLTKSREIDFEFKDVALP